MKQSAIDKAIAEFQSEQQMLQRLIDKLRATQAAKPKRERKAKTATEPKA